MSTGFGQSSIYRSFSTGLLLGVVCAVLVALPGAARTARASEGSTLLLCWLALGGGLGLLLAPAVGAARAARPLPRPAVGLPLGALFASGPLMLLATLIKAKTHHRPLGAATFAMLAAVLLVAAIIVAARLLSATEGKRPFLAWGSIVILAVVSGAMMARLVQPALGAVGAESGLRAALFDGVLLVVLGAAAVGLKVPDGLRNAARYAAPALWIGLALASAVVLRRSPDLVQAASEKAPVLLGLGAWLGG